MLTSVQRRRLCPPRRRRAVRAQRKEPRDGVRRPEPRDVQVGDRDVIQSNTERAGTRPQHAPQVVFLAGVARRLAEGLGDAVEVNAADVRTPDGVAPEAEPVRAELDRGADVALEQTAMATASELLRSQQNAQHSVLTI